MKTTIGYNDIRTAIAVRHQRGGSWAICPGYVRNRQTGEYVDSYSTEQLDALESERDARHTCIAAGNAIDCAECRTEGF